MLRLMKVMIKKIRIAFVKFGGLSAGGTERWLQTMAFKKRYWVNNLFGGEIIWL